MQSTTTLKRYDGDQIVLLNQNLDVIGLNDPLTSKAKWAQLEVRSVQHTGTCFLHELLRKNGWYVRASHYNATTIHDTGLIISPIRQPEDVWVTWASRKRKENFFEAWKYFNQMYISNPELIVIPVDTADKNIHLQRLGLKLKCSLATNWKPVGARPREKVELIDLTEIYKLEVVKRYYENN